jgi:hypothetical protein
MLAMALYCLWATVLKGACEERQMTMLKQN